MKNIMNHIVLWSKIIVYLALGIFILIMQDDLLGYLRLIVSIPLLVLSLQELALAIAEKSYKKEFNDFGPIGVRIVLAVVLLFVNSEDLLTICVIWGIMVVITATMDLSSAVLLFNQGHKIGSLLITAQAVTQIILSIMLVIDPIEHVSLHIIVLGIEMLFVAFKGLGVFYHGHFTKKKKKKEKER